ncbi:MAG: uroporphyrinogen-III synthase [Candidatus Methylomirabilales bacterium]
MRLKGLTVAVTGSRRALDLAHLISNFGGTPYVAPTVGIEVEEDVDLQMEGLVHRIVGEEFDYAVFMTGPGVYRLMSTAQKLGVEREVVDVLNRTYVIARSHKPQKVLEKYVIQVRLVPSDNTSEGIAGEMEKLDLRGKSVALLWHGDSHSMLRETLEGMGANVFEAMAYKYSLDLEKRGAELLEAAGFKSIPPGERKMLQLVDDLGKGTIHIITFTSPPSVRNLFRFAEAHGLDNDLRSSLNEDVLVVAVGPPTRRAIEENRVNVDVMPDVYKLGPMMRAIVDYLAHPPSQDRKKALVGVQSRTGEGEGG